MKIINELGRKVRSAFSRKALMRALSCSFLCNPLIITPPPKIRFVNCRDLSGHLYISIVFYYQYDQFRCL
ncbi:hypothetical protein LJB78_00810 [Bacteroidales bacterium OttesenSCG-928-J16]|nr:hypothetical protein [Bacteroidales bacterium OttesenSCG-928-J16]